jgi:hypothetical protein
MTVDSVEGESLWTIEAQHSLNVLTKARVFYAIGAGSSIFFARAWGPRCMSLYLVKESKGRKGRKALRDVPRSLSHFLDKRSIHHDSPEVGHKPLCIAQTDTSGPNLQGPDDPSNRSTV